MEAPEISSVVSEKCEWVPGSLYYRKYRPWTPECQRCGACKPTEEPSARPEYRFHPEAFKNPRRKGDKWVVDVTCPGCGRSWTGTKREFYTCRVGDGGCGYAFRP